MLKMIQYTMTKNTMYLLHCIPPIVPQVFGATFISKLVWQAHIKCLAVIFVVVLLIVFFHYIITQFASIWIDWNNVGILILHPQ